MADRGSKGRRIHFFCHVCGAERSSVPSDYDRLLMGKQPPTCSRRCSEEMRRRMKKAKQKHQCGDDCKGECSGEVTGTPHCPHAPAPDGCSLNQTCENCTSQPVFICSMQVEKEKTEAARTATLKTLDAILSKAEIILDGHEKAVWVSDIESLRQQAGKQR